MPTKKGMKTTTRMVIVTSLIALGLLIFYIFKTIRPWNLTNILLVSSIIVAMVALLVGILSVSLTLHKEREELSKSRIQGAMQKEQLTAIINNLASAIITTDKRGVINIYNAATLSLLDTNKSLAKKPIDEVLRLVDLDGKKFSVAKTLKNINSIESNSNLIYKLDGDDFLRVELSMSPIKSSYFKRNHSEVSGYILIISDITKAKSLEEERDEFISVISHELRTPVTIVEGSISNLMVMLDRKIINSAKFKSALKTAHEQTVFLSSIINDLSTLSRAEKDIRSNLEKIDVSSLLTNLFKRYADEAKKKDIKLNLDMAGVSDYVIANSLYLNEALQNIMTNALKYTPKGTITIGSKKEKNRIVIFVSDTGIGISKTDQQHVFEKFYRSEDYRTRETGGTGLGLYVTAKLVSLMGAKINLESRLNHGSTFSLIFDVPKN